MVKYRVSINGIEVEAYYSQQAVNQIFCPLLKKLTELQKEKDRRILVMLAAPPGCGKTTLVSFLEKLSREREEFTPIQAIGMDGFHRRQEYLLSHEVEIEGIKMPMVKIKGAPVTFDLEKLQDRVKKVAAGENCGWPVYDRLLHNPTDDVIQVTGKIVLLEGNYLLLDMDGWRELSASADFTISVTADEALLRDRLIDRRMKTGVEKEAAVSFVDFSDMSNVRVCLKYSKPADLMLRIDEKGDYREL